MDIFWTDFKALILKLSKGDKWINDKVYILINYVFVNCCIFFLLITNLIINILKFAITINIRFLGFWEDMENKVEDIFTILVYGLPGVG